MPFCLAPVDIEDAQDPPSDGAASSLDVLVPCARTPSGAEAVSQQPAQPLQVFDMAQEDDDDDAEGHLAQDASPTSDDRTSWWDAPTPVQLGPRSRAETGDEIEQRAWLSVQQGQLSERERALCDELRKAVVEQLKKTSERAETEQVDHRALTSSLQEHAEAALRSVVDLQQAVAASMEDVRHLAAQIQGLQQQPSSQETTSATASTVASSSPCKEAALDEQVHALAGRPRCRLTEEPLPAASGRRGGDSESAQPGIHRDGIEMLDQELGAAKLCTVSELRGALLKAERRAQVAEERRRASRAEATAALRNLEICQSQLASSHCDVLELEDRVEELTSSMRSHANAGKQAALSDATDHWLAGAPPGGPAACTYGSPEVSRFCQQLFLARRWAAEAERSRLIELRDISKCRGELDKLRDQLEPKDAFSFGQRVAMV